MLPYQRMAALTACKVSDVSGISQRKTRRHRVDRLMLATDCTSFSDPGPPLLLLAPAAAALTLAPRR